VRLVEPDTAVSTRAGRFPDRGSSVTPAGRPPPLGLVAAGRDVRNSAAALASARLRRLRIPAPHPTRRLAHAAAPTRAV